METPPDVRPALYTQEAWRRYVSSCGDPEPDPRDRRRDCRYRIAFGHATLTLPGGETASIVEGQLINISAGGLMVQVRKHLPAGTPLWIDIDINGQCGALVGRIVHTTQCVGGYKLGIQLVFPDAQPA